MAPKTYIVASDPYFQKLNETVIPILTGAITTIIAFIFALSETYWDLVLNNTHAILGFIVFIAMFMQMALGFARPGEREVNQLDYLSPMNMIPESRSCKF